jgi:TolB-like protein
MLGKNVKLSVNRARVRRTIAFALVLLAPALLAWRPALADSASSYDDAIKQVSSQLADAISSSGKKTVAVTDFTDLDGNVTELGRFLASDLSDSLAAQAKGFLVIDRTQFKSAPQESSVDAIVTGNLTTFADHVRLSTKLLDATNSAILSAASVDIPRTKDIDDLLAGSRPTAPMKSSSTGAAASSGSSNASAPSQTAANEGPVPAVTGQPPAVKTKASRASSKPPKKPSTPGAPSLTGIGSVATDTYRITAMSLDRAGGTVSVTLEFDSLSDSTILLAMVRAQTYLTDETNVRWALNQQDTLGIFNVREMAGGGFWRGVPLARGAKIKTVLTFTPQGPAVGTKFTLTIAEFRPKWNRVLAIQGLQ